MPVNRGISIAIGLLCLCRTAASAQGLSPYTEFQGLGEPELATLQGKITTVGTVFKGMYTLAFSATGHAVDLGTFVPFYRPQFQNSYTLDYKNPPTFQAATSELAALLDSVATLPGVTDGGIDSSAGMSFALSVVKSRTTKVFEAILDTTNCRLLYGRLLGALSSNAGASEAVAHQACSFGLLPGPRQADMTAQVSIAQRGFRKDRKTGQYVGKVRVTNAGSASIPAPIILTFRPDENIELASRDGYTCAVFPPGAPYQSLLTTGSLGSGQHVDVVLRFVNPDGDPIQLYLPHVYGGPGFH